MDEFNRNTEQEASEQTTPYQTPVRGAEEQPGSGYHQTGGTYEQTRSSSTYSSSYYGNTQDSTSYDSNGGGSTPPPGGTTYEQWSGGKKPNKPKKPEKPFHFPWKPVVAGVLIAAIAFGGGMLAGGGIKLPAMGGGDSAGYGVTDNGSGTDADTQTVEIQQTKDDLGSYSEVI